MIAQKTKTLLLWVPTTVLLIATLVVVLTLVLDSRQRIANLEDGQNPSVITFTFNQPTGRFRIVCNEDTVVPNFYNCASIRIGPANRTPSPSRSPGG